MRQLTATDAFFLFSERQQTPNHIGMLQIYDPSEAPGGPVQFNSMLADLDSRLHLARAFREKVVSARLGLDFPYWIDDPDFDLEYHVRHIGLPKPGNWQQLCTQAAQLHSRMLDRSRPLWEMTVIEGLDELEGVPPGSFAIYFKIHHAAIDGVAGAELLTATHANSPVDPVTPPTKPWTPESAPSGWGLLARAATNNLHRPVRAIRSAIPALPSARGVVKALARRPSLSALGNSVPTTRFNGAVTAHRTMDARSYDLNDLKRIKNAIPRATVNDVALAVVSGALRGYLGTHGELPDASLVAAVPISTRLPGDERGGNRISIMTSLLATDVADPVERVAAIAAATRARKEQANAVRARALADAAQVIPGGVVGVAMRRLAPLVLARRPIANVVVTNVPGPPQPLYAFGSRMVSCYGMGPILDGLGIIHLVGSYAGAFTFSFTACREMVPDPTFYGECIHDAMSELRKATAAARPAPAFRNVTTEGNHGTFRSKLPSR
jgi:diacylglycerol O-acyltransferase